MIVITTPTGQIGHQILEQILDSGKPICVIVRDPSRLDPKIRDRVEIVEGSHDNIDVVTNGTKKSGNAYQLSSLQLFT
ncbi:NAD(P)H-binding protein [Nostoc sp. MG11]|uniref:NAD(P)H-binding protein n=1 Tax=Nostoc sp. MG11 TaxID=2721166 RepID=UPI001867CA31|nr:NAD(P)H-binding protein [Nostoc sp. MG11]